MGNASTLHSTDTTNTSDTESAPIHVTRSGVDRPGLGGGHPTSRAAQRRQRPSKRRLPKATQPCGKKAEAAQLQSSISHLRRGNPTNTTSSKVPRPSAPDGTPHPCDHTSLPQLPFRQIPRNFSDCSAKLFHAMASDPPGSSPSSSKLDTPPPTREDAETTATRKELRNTSISGPSTDVLRTSTPDVAEEDVTSKNQISSPKKKRAHDQVEDDPAAAAKSLNVCADANTKINRSHFGHKSRLESRNLFILRIWSS